MIYGIGNDILEVSRLSDYKRSTNLALKVLTAYEYDVFKNLSEAKAIKYLANQYVCKEAISKAFGTGIRNEVIFTNMEIHRDSLGKPVLTPLGKLKELMENEQITNTHVTISDTNMHSLATVVLETG